MTDVTAELHLVLEGRRALSARLADDLDLVDLLRWGTHLNAAHGDLQTREQPAGHALDRACGLLRQWLDGEGAVTPARCVAEVVYAVSLSPLRDRLFRAPRWLMVALQTQDSPMCRLWDDDDRSQAPALPNVDRVVDIGADDLA